MDDVLWHCGRNLSSDDVVDVAEQTQLCDAITFRGRAEGGTGIDLQYMVHNKVSSTQVGCDGVCTSTVNSPPRAMA